ncbi:MAG: glycosyltransferase family 2 protein [Methylobacteriaceae bacterium]|nr:glycosyltransferase family 2 protein [Methylobacteriaceae bacterium]MBV9246583.1 glycosyltransferase family 2 protein [Methylobacteriaceae bacterium]
MKSAQTQEATSPAKGRLLTRVTRPSESSIAGYVIDPADPDRRFVVELLIDGIPAQIARAQMYDHELAQAGVGDGCNGFVFRLPSDLVGESQSGEVRLANSGESLGPPVIFETTPVRADLSGGPGGVWWLGGLRLAGWVPRTKDGALPSVQAFIDGELVCEVKADKWGHAARGVGSDPVPSFDMHLPAHYADATVKRVAVSCNGQSLSGSPLALVAFADGLRQFLAAHDETLPEEARGRLFDRLFPQSMPFSAFDDWSRRYPLPAPTRLSQDPVGVVIIGNNALDATLESLAAEESSEWVVGVLPTVSGQVDFLVDDLVEFLTGAGSTCKTLIVALAGTRFRRGAVNLLAQALEENDQSKVVYPDILLAGGDGLEWPIALSAFDYERVIEQGCGAMLFAIRHAIAALAAEKRVDDIFRLFNLHLDGRPPGEADFLHVPGFAAVVPAFDREDAQMRLGRATAAHLATRGVNGEIWPGAKGALPGVRVRRQVPAGPVSILIPTRNRPDLLKSCLNSLAGTIKLHGAELVIIDNDSTDPECLRYLGDIRRSGAVVIRAAGPFNFARLMNAAVAAASGEHLCLLNNDVMALDNDWLAEMLSRLSEPSVGAVGALLLWPSRLVQHGGVVLGPSFSAAHAFTGRPESDPGYGDLLAVAHECSAVTAACLLTRKRDYIDVGGMDELRFPVQFNDVDYCLKLRSRGRRIVFTPHARLLHLESASRGFDDSADREGRASRELENLRARWHVALADDPFYSPLLSLDPIPFSGLAWPPRQTSPRFPKPTQQLEIPPGI